jgi:hypothetical protein
MKLHGFFSAAALLLVAACTPAADKAETNTAEATCPDDGPRLPRTGFCQGRAANYCDPERLVRSSGELPERCMMVVNETTTPDPDQAILYNALRCGDKTTKLAFSAGARGASLGRETSGYFEQVPAAGEDGWEAVRLFPLDGVADPKAMILEIAKRAAAEEKVGVAEIAACEVRPAGEGFPADAVLIDVNDAYKKKNKLGAYDAVKDGPGAGLYAACGSFGITDGADFWMIRDGYAWHVRQGHDLPDFDAGSLTVFGRGADRAWAPKG